MFETNIENNIGRISLARAAQLTGYHQDYLGQLCRMGKLEAIKIGRNWFTSSTALNSLAKPPTLAEEVAQEIIDESILAQSVAPSVQVLHESPAPQDESEAFAVPKSNFFKRDRSVISQTPQSIVNSYIVVPEERVQIRTPIISQNITINDLDENELFVNVDTDTDASSAVEEMPISIRTIPSSPRVTNEVQNILTNRRIEELQQEVFQLRSLLMRLMEEVKSHTSILQSHATVSRVQDSLKHAYVSNFDLTMPEQRISYTEEMANPQDSTQPIIWFEPQRPRYALMQWVAATAAIVVVSFVGIGIVQKSFFGSEPVVSTVYHRDAPIQEPEVAGATILPTDGAGELIPTMIP